MNKTGIIAMTSALAMFAASGFAAFAEEAVSFNMSWLPQGSVGGVIVAKSLGYFQEEGLDVTLNQGYGGQRTVNEIDQGLFDIGYGDPVSVILNRANGGATRFIGTINTVWPAALCYLKKDDKVIDGLDDIAGMSLGGGATSPVQVVVPAWLEANNLPRDHVKLLQMNPAVISTAFLDGEIDLAECWEGASLPILTQTAAESGKEIGMLRYRDFGLDIYGSGFVTSEAMLTEKPETVDAFLRAAYRGYEYMAANPEAAADIMVAEFPILKRPIVLEQIQQINALVVDPGAAGEPIGYIREDRMQGTIDFIVKAFDLDPATATSNLYENRTR